MKEKTATTNQTKKRIQISFSIQSEFYFFLFYFLLQVSCIYFFFLSLYIHTIHCYWLCCCCCCFLRVHDSFEFHLLAFDYISWYSILFFLDSNWNSLTETYRDVVFLYVFSFPSFCHSYLYSFLYILIILSSTTTRRKNLLFSLGLYRHIVKDMLFEWLIVVYFKVKKI